MLNLFRKNNSFPKETELGNIYIVDDQLFYEDHTNKESVDLSILKYAYVEILGEDPYLFLFDYMQHYIPVLQHGFSKIYSLLSERFGFDDTNVITLPQLMGKKNQHRNAVWLANDNTFGFTGDQYAIQFNRKDVSQIIVQNVLPAKGGGYAEFFVRLKSDDLVIIYYGEQNTFDAYVQPLQEFLGIEVETPEPYYNC